MLNATKILPLYLAIIFSAGCNMQGVDIINSTSGTEYLKDKNGNNVRDCSYTLLSLRGGATIFWEENNLPKGTTEFVCKNGKAYLPNQVPNDQ